MNTTVPKYGIDYQNLQQCLARLGKGLAFVEGKPLQRD